MKEAGSVHPGGGSPGASVGRSDALMHRDEHGAASLEEGMDEGGGYLVIEHEWTRLGSMAGPHSHPAVGQAFTVQEGRVGFRVDKLEIFWGQR